jgi:hypothetical protein
MLDSVFTKRVGRYKAHVDILQPDDVDEILGRALAEHRQHPEFVAIVQHGGHVGAHDRHRTADRRRNHRHGAGIERVAFAQLNALNRFGLLRPDATCQDSEYNANGCAQDSMHGGLCSTVRERR